MNRASELRTSRRVPFTKQVKVLGVGKAVICVLAVNISMGGVLLSASSPLPVGVHCKLEIPATKVKGGEKLQVEGTVVRSDVNGTAIQFATPLENRMLESVSTAGSSHFGARIARTYLNYFKVSQDKEHRGSWELLGVSPSTFKTVFMTSFLTCIPLAVAPVWVVKNSLPLVSNAMKVAAALGYVAIWFVLIQPIIDLTAFWIIRHRKAHQASAGRS